MAKVMGYAGICSVIAGRAGVSSARADHVVKAVLQALAEQADAQAWHVLQDRLPAELVKAVSATQQHDPRSVDAFLERVAELDGTTAAQARRPVLAAVAALQHALGDQILTELLDPHESLFTQLVPPPAELQDEQAFLHRVQERAGLDTLEQAVAATDNTLDALAERITAGQATDLAVYLPPPLRAHLTSTSRPARPFDYAEFLARIAGQRQPAEVRAAAVLSTLREAAPEAEIQHTLAQLPDDLCTFFG